MDLHHRAPWPTPSRRELPEVPPGQILLEPEGRNTAPAIGWSIRSMPEAVRRGAVAVLPADHRMGDPAAFRDALERAARAVEADDRVMTLGVTPRWAETGYGYLELEKRSIPSRREETACAGCAVSSRSPTLENAERFVRSGDYLWNAGIFVFRGTAFLDVLARLQPELARGLEEIAAAPDRAGGDLSAPACRLDRLCGDGEARRDLDALARLRLERSRLLVGPRRGAAPRRRGQLRARRHAGRRRRRQSAVRRCRPHRGARGEGPGRRAHRRHRPGDAQGAVAGGAPDRRRSWPPAAARSCFDPASPRSRPPPARAASPSWALRFLSTLWYPATRTWEVEIGFGKGRYLLRRCRRRARTAASSASRSPASTSSMIGRARRGAAAWRTGRRSAAMRSSSLSAVLPHGFAAASTSTSPTPGPRPATTSARLFDPETVDLVLRLLAPRRQSLLRHRLPGVRRAGAGDPGVLSRPARRAARPPLGRGARTNYEAKYLIEGRPILRLQGWLEGPALLHPRGAAGVLVGLLPEMAAEKEKKMMESHV